MTTEATKKNYLKWASVIIFILVLLYNTVVTHVILKNDVKHQGRTIVRLEKKVDTLIFKLVEK